MVREQASSTGVDMKANTRAAAHLSSLSTPFSLMQLAMMMAEATPSISLERSIFSVGLVPLSPSASAAPPLGPRLFIAILPARERQCQRALTQKQTLWGGGAPQVGDLRLLEDGGERGGALGPDLVKSQTVSEEQS